MSSIKLTELQELRLSDSRRRIRDALFLALGAYTEQEGKKYDSWRDMDWHSLFRHLQHEMKELEKSNDKTKQLHNSVDACALSAILVAKVIWDDE